MRWIIGTGLALALACTSEPAKDPHEPSNSTPGAASHAGHDHSKHAGAPRVQAQKPTIDPIEYRKSVMSEIPTVVAETNCQCCNKPLKQCYDETINKDAGACPDT